MTKDNFIVVLPPIVRQLDSYNKYFLVKITSLRYVLEILYCQKILEIFCGVRNDKSSYLLDRAGDCCFMTVQECKVQRGEA